MNTDRNSESAPGPIRRLLSRFAPARSDVAGDPTLATARPKTRRSGLFARTSLVGNRRGVALILTLGLLSLMMVLALAFAMSSLAGSHSAAYSVELTKSRQIAEMGLQRVVSMLKIELWDTSNHDTFYPGTKIFIEGSGDWKDFYYVTGLISDSGETQMTDELMDRLGHSVNDLDYIPSTPPTGVDRNGNALALASMYSWLPIYENSTMENVLVDRLVARYGFIVLDETGKIDPNSVVDTTYAEGTEVASGFNDGIYLSEISLTDLGFSSSFAGKLRSKSVGGMQPSNAKWFSRYHIARITGLTGSAGQSSLDLLNSMTFPYRRPDKLNDQREITDSGYEATFDLATLSNTQTGNNLAYIRDTIVNPVANVSPGIPWLANWLSDGHFATDSDRFLYASHQAYNIAGNILDYNDTNRDASRDQVGYTSGTEPTFWGNEPVPYINRVEVRVKNVSILTNLATQVEPRVDVYVKPQLVNMFGDITSYATKCKIEIKGKVIYIAQNGTAFTKELTWLWDPFDPVTNANISGSFGSSGYITLSGDGLVANAYSGTSITPSSGTALSYLPLVGVNVAITHVQVSQYNGTEKWDFAMPSGGFDTDKAKAPLSWGTNDEAYWMYETRCPMNNLFPLDWYLTGPTTTGQLSSATNTSYWTDTKRRIMIRNAPMQHVVELGQIWRMDPYSTTDAYKAFRTLNLIDYQYYTQPQFVQPAMYSDAEDGVIDNYDNTINPNEGNGGDRNILDMVRIGNSDSSEREMIGRLNINTRRRPVLAALFNRLTKTKYTWNEDITAAERNEVIDHILSKTYPDDPSLTTKVAGPVPIGLLDNNRNPPLYGLLFQPAEYSVISEDKLEYLLCLTRQLINGKHNYFTCVVTSQTIKDVGQIYDPYDELEINGVKSRIARYDLGADLIQAEQKIRVILYRDATNNKISVERFDYLDE